LIIEKMGGKSSTHEGGAKFILNLSRKMNGQLGVNGRIILNGVLISTV
jgi:hypothetical protein